MPQIVDQFGNPFRGQLDTVGDEVVTETGRTYVKTIGALNAEVVMDLNGAATATFDIRTAAGSLTFVFEGSVDGVNYDILLPAFATRSLVAAVTSAEVYVFSVVVATTIASTYVVGVTGLKKIRLRISAYTSGNINVAARASSADQIIYSKPIPVTLWVTVTAAANTAATITIPAAGAGLFHYFVYLNCRRHSTAVLAGTATLIITTTNLPGTLAWSNGNAMAAGDTKEDVNFQPGIPLKSLLANTATTIVMPAPGAAVLNRGNCGYYIGA
jgi:hypothetical protein